MKKKKDPAAVSLGRRGGIKRAQKLTPERRLEIAKKATNARWKKAKAAKKAPPENPE